MNHSGRRRILAASGALALVLAIGLAYALLERSKERMGAMPAAAHVDGLGEADVAGVSQGSLPEGSRRPERSIEGPPNSPAAVQEPEAGVGTVLVRLERSDGLDIANVRVTLLPLQSAQSTQPILREAGVPGTVAFDGLRAGECLVSAEPNRVEPEEPEVGDPDYMNKAFEASAKRAPLFERVRVEAGATSTVDFLFEAPGSVLGVVVGPHSEPVEGAQVRLSFEGSPFGHITQDALCDPLGEFSFGDVTPGEYFLNVFVGNKRGGVVETGPLYCSLATEPTVLFTVHPGVATHRILTIGGGKYSIAGRVTDETGAPVKNLPVLVYYIPGRSDAASKERKPRHDWGDTIALPATQDDGRFSAEGVQPGEYNIAPGPEGYILCGSGTPTKLAHWVDPIHIVVGDGPLVVDAGTVVVSPSRLHVFQLHIQLEHSWQEVHSAAASDIEITQPTVILASGERVEISQPSIRRRGDGDVRLTIELGALHDPRFLSIRLEHGSRGNKVSSTQEFLIEPASPQDCGTVLFPSR